MAKEKPVNAPTLAAMTADAARGLSRRKLQSLYPNAPERLIRAILQAGIGADEWRDLMGQNLRSLAAEATERLREELRKGRVSPNSLPLTIGILTDKAEQVEQAGNTLTISAKLSVTGLSRSDLVALAAGDRIGTKTTAQDSAADNAVPLTLLR